MRCDICDKEYVGRPAYILHEGKMVWACPRCAKKYGQIKPWEKREEAVAPVAEPKAAATPPTVEPAPTPPTIKPPEVAPIPPRPEEKPVPPLEQEKRDMKLGMPQSVGAALLEELRKMNQKLDTLIELVNEL